MENNEKKGSSVIGFVVIAVIILGIIALIMSGNEKDTTKVAGEISKKPNTWYYNQLDNGYKKYGKYIYEKLYQNKEELKSGHTTIYLDDYFSSILEDNYDEGQKHLETSIFMAKNAMEWDNPDIFYVDYNKMEGNLIKSDKYRVTLSSKENENYYIDGITSKEQVTKMEQEIKDATSQIMSELKSLNNDYDKIKRVHDYLIETIEYADGENAHNIYGALVNKKCVCEGYAKAFQYFMNELNIESVYVTGKTTGALWSLVGSNHAWNYVKLNGNWYGIDATWDDADNKQNEYFLRGKERMDKDHTTANTLGDLIMYTGIKSFNTKVNREESITYPTLSITDYQNR